MERDFKESEKEREGEIEEEKRIYMYIKKTFHSNDFRVAFSNINWMLEKCLLGLLITVTPGLGLFPLRRTTYPDRNEIQTVSSVYTYTEKDFNGKVGK